MCLDLLGLIAIGRYQPGDRLPTHDQLQKLYGVSRDTSVKAVRMPQDWGVVTAAPRRGISVEMNLAAPQKIHIAPEAIALPCAAVSGQPGFADPDGGTRRRPRGRFCVSRRRQRAPGGDPPAGETPLTSIN